jgi:tetratricopeptide (TPR) repeat protein
MWRLALAAVLLIAASPTVAPGRCCAAAEAAEPPVSSPTVAADRSSSAAEVGRIVRVEQWLKAILHHEPGTADDAVESVASWSVRDMRTLWIDAGNLLLLMRNPRIVRFDIRQPGQRGSQPIRYTSTELRRLHVLACAAAGIVTASQCVAIKAATELDSELLQLSRLAADARLHGDDNYVLRRGALLHTDVGMLTDGAAEPVDGGSSPGPQRIRMSIADGRETNLQQAAVHWDVARMLLDQVRPRRSDTEAGADRPAPARDDMVRQWYGATAAWMQWKERHETVHLDHAREIFPADADILFLSGSLHETYAGSRVQSALRTAILPTGVKLALGSERDELREAEGFFRRAVEVKPDFVEARLHLGCVLARLGRPADAVKELTLALASTDDELLRYYGELFLGAAHEATGQLDAAGASYARAAALQPGAQSPLIALSALARRRGDRAGALREIRRVFDLPSSESRDDDPWWTYHVSQARNADELFEEMIRPFLSTSEGRPR